MVVSFSSSFEWLPRTLPSVDSFLLVRVQGLGFRVVGSRNGCDAMAG